MTKAQLFQWVQFNQDIPETLVKIKEEWENSPEILAEVEEAIVGWVDEGNPTKGKG